MMGHADVGRKPADAQADIFARHGYNGAARIFDEKQLTPSGGLAQREA
jgi:hypothetical protein